MDGGGSACRWRNIPESSARAEEGKLIRSHPSGFYRVWKEGVVGIRDGEEMNLVCSFSLES
jgi:hypothetical protein